jgi:hypothetical protein
MGNGETFPFPFPFPPLSLASSPFPFPYSPKFRSAHYLNNRAT